jgi:lipoyl(octanoyl) transferase
MAVDAALLENPSRLSIPTLRVYRWVPPCISLGIHQSPELLDLDRCLAEGMDVVRRPTGGRAVLHWDEVTYALVIPTGSEFPLSDRSLLTRRIGEALASGLQSIGVPAEWTRRTSAAATPSGRGLEGACFSSAARHELVVGGRKLAGSAQRFSETGMLQHGSILFGERHLDLCRYLTAPRASRDAALEGLRNKTTTIREHAGPSVTVEEAGRAVRAGFETAWRAVFHEAPLTAEETELSLALRPRFAIVSTGGAG